MGNGNRRALMDYTNKDYAALRDAMLALASEKFEDWTDHSPNDLGVLLVELFAYMGDMMLYYQDRIANESYLDTAAERRSIIHLLRLIGYELRPPQPASADLTAFFDPDAEGSVTLEKGTAFQTSAQATGTPVTFRYVGDPLTIELGALEPHPYRDAKGKEKQGLRFVGLPVIQADPRLLERTLSILVDNAFNYTPSGGRIDISTHSEQAGEIRWVGFKVSDTGAGIPVDEQSRLFERFFRGKVTLDTGTSGTGLGLATAKAIVEQHRGKIEAESEGLPGKGAVFTVWLPVDA